MVAFLAISFSGDTRETENKNGRKRLIHYDVGRALGEGAVMEQMNQTASDVKTGKRKKRDTPKRPGVSPDKEKVTFYLSSEAIQRVGIAATMEKKANSSIVEELINTHLRKWVVSCRTHRGDAIESETGAGASEQVA